MAINKNDSRLTSSVECLKQFKILNPDLDIRRFNFFNITAVDKLKEKLQGNRQQKSNKNQVDKLTIEKDDVIKEQIAQLKAIQRLLRLFSRDKELDNTGATKSDLMELDPNELAAAKLYSQRLHSAYQIASIPKHRFINEYANCFSEDVDNGKNQAKQIHRRALAIKNKTVLDYVKLKQQYDTHYRSLRFDNLNKKNKQAGNNVPTLAASSDIRNSDNYSNLPDYESLFGGLDYCTCPDCRSIFSPAAYFVDLMRLLSHYIKMGDKSGEEIIKERRPDLLELELSCDNTNKLVSKLEIVNEVLLKQVNPNQSDEDNYKALATAKYPFNLPFNLALTKIRNFLSGHNVSLAQLWEVLIPWETLTPEQIINQQQKVPLEQLSISIEQWQVCSVKEINANTIAELYGLSSGSIDELNSINKFLEQTGLSYQQLDELLYQNLTEGELNRRLNKKFFINNNNEPVGKSDSGTFTNCNAENFDRMHRFIRLAQFLNWSFTDLDWALRAVNNGNSDITDDILPYLAWIKVLKDNQGFSVNEACGFLYQIKDFGSKSEATFFDQIFNAPSVLNPPAWYNSETNLYDLTWTIPEIDNGSIDGNNQIQNALAQALKLNNNDVLTIAQAVLEANNRGTKGNQTLTLSLTNLSLLYRLSLLSRITGKSINESIVAYNLMDIKNTNLLKDLALADVSGSYNIITELFKSIYWLQTRNLSTYLVQYWLTGNSDDKAIQNQVLGINALNNAVNELYKALTSALLDESKFAQNIDSFLNSIDYTLINTDPSEQQISADAISDDIWNNIVVKYYMDEKGVVTNLPSDAADIKNKLVTLETCKKLNPTDLENIARQVCNILAHYQQLQEQTFNNQLASLYSIDPKLLEIVAKEWVNLSISDIAGLSVSSKPGLIELIDEDDVTKKLKEIQRYISWISTLQYSYAEIKDLNNNSEYFGIDKHPHLILTDIQTLVNFKYLTLQLGDSQGRLLQYCNDAASLLADEAALKLSEVTGWDQSQLSWLIDKLWPSVPSVPKPWVLINNILLLQSYFTLAKQTHTDVSILWNLTQIPTENITTYEQLEDLAHKIWAGLQEKCQDNASSLEGLANIILNKQRDALLPYVIDKLKTQGVNNARDLYEYLLIDVEVDAVVKSSYIVEANSSLQLFIYRCLNNLEQEITIEEDLYQQWEWMENYRVWQANREVFLYPENYIEPNLRKNKSKLFTDLENNLQQADISNQDNVANALSSYLDSLVQIADLEIVGSSVYDHVDQEQAEDNYKQLFLVGASREQPISYYYLTAILKKGTYSDMPDLYSPVEWGQWLPITGHMQPKGSVTPIFAFNKWFIFWVEQQQSGSDQDKDGKQQKLYTATVCYSYLNSSNNWVTKQNFDPINLGTGQVCENLPSSVDKAPSVDSVYLKNTVYPVYINSVQTLYVLQEEYNYTKGTKSSSLNNKVYSLTDTDLSQSLVSATRYIANTVPALPDSLKNEYEYKNDNINTKVSYYQNNKISLTAKDNFTISIWFYLHRSRNDFKLIEQPGESISITITPSKNLFVNNLSINNESIALNLVKPNTWNHLVINKSKECHKINSVTLSDTSILNPPFFDFSNIIIVGGKSYTFLKSYGHGNHQVYYGEITTPYNSMDIFTHLIQDGIQEPNSLSSAKFNDLGYFSWATWNSINIHILYADGNLGGDAICFSVDQVSWHKLISYKNKLYVVWGKYDNGAWLGWLSDGGDIKNEIQDTLFLTDDKSIFGRLTDALVFNNKLYLLSFTEDEAVFIAKLWTLQDIQAETTVKLLTEYRFDVDDLYTDTHRNKLFGLLHIDDKLWLRWVSFILNPDEGRFYPKNELGWVVDCDGIVKHQIQDVTIINRQLSGPVTFSTQLYADTLNQNYLITMVSEPYKMTEYGMTYTSWLDAFPLSNSSTYFNGQPLLSYDLNQILYSSSDIQVNCCSVSSMQEVLYFDKALDKTEIAELYEHSKNRITLDFTNTVDVSQGNAFGIDVRPTETPILTQPNWNIIKYNDANFLSLPYSFKFNRHFLLKCTRLNSTAVRKLSGTLSLFGIDSLLNIDSQKTKEIPFIKLSPNKTYIPKVTYPSDTIDLTNGPMSNYYWELFFHVPFFVAYQLQTNQQFEYAKKWYEYIFNPTVKQSEWQLDDPNYPNDKYWRFIGLRSSCNTTLAEDLDEPWSEEIKQDTSNTAQLYEYHNNPFDPHAIASLRPISYQKTMLMHYISNLLNWGDDLYRQYTTESITEAMMLYITAYDLLGKQPTNLGECKLPDEINYEQLIEQQNKHDSNEFIIILEQVQKSVPVTVSSDNPVNYIANSYFGLPDNEQFNSYWGKVINRLYNLRHSLTIDGVLQAVALFAPALDPMQLVKQIGSGTSLSQALTDISAIIPFYRFTTCLMKAKEVTSTVIQFGQALLAALEKKDAESLARLNSTNSQNLLALTSTSKENELKAAEASLQALQTSLISAQHRLDYYTGLINSGWSDQERSEINLNQGAITSQYGAQPFKVAAAIAHAFPTIFGLADGGFQPGSALAETGGTFEGTAFALNMSAGLAGIIASYQRRSQDWQLQQTMTNDDIQQIQAQIIATQYQQIMAQQDITLLEKNIEQEQKVEQFLISKFTNQDLYQWLIGKLSALYFQAYQLAFKLAKQAEQAFQFEKGTYGANPVIHGNWDSLHNGLLAGEALMLDLHRMEQSYMEQDKRRLEIVKTISLANLSKDVLNKGQRSLDKLKESGNCIFEFMEKDFDLDYPGHYCRQIKTISLSFPALLGPYQDIHATLIQTSNKTLLSADNNGVSYLLGTIEDAPDSVKSSVIANQQIALSQGVNDFGLFSLNFNDERYLPFEGTGAVSTWSLEIPKETNAGILESLTDVIIQIRYTALVGDSAFRKTVADLVLPVQLGATLVSLTHNESAGKIVATWTTVLKAQQYQVLLVLPDQTTVVKITTSILQYEFNVADFNLNGEYKVQVKAIGASNNIIPSISDANSIIKLAEPEGGLEYRKGEQYPLRASWKKVQHANLIENYKLNWILPPNGSIEEAKNISQDIDDNSLLYKTRKHNNNKGLYKAEVITKGVNQENKIFISSVATYECNVENL